MQKTILVTGGAGFIGSHLADQLLAAGYAVRALDALVAQVHGEDRRRPTYLHPDVDLRIGDVREPEDVARAVDGVDAVVHLAAAVGVGQSMYELARYTETNNLGTAVLLEALNANPVERLVVASSMSVYGEGRYRAADGTVRDDVRRNRANLEAGCWEPRDEGGPQAQPAHQVAGRADGRRKRAEPQQRELEEAGKIAGTLTPVHTPEDKRPALASVYALSKFDQERMWHCFADIGRASEVLGYAPEVGLEEGLTELVEWLATQQPEDRVEQARRELDTRGLTV